MAKLKDALLKFAEKLGLEKDTDLMTVLAASVLSEIEVPDSFITAASGLMTEQQAIDFGMASLEVKTKHLKNYLIGFDESTIDLAKKAGLSEDTIKEIKAAQNSGDKVKLLATALQGEIETAKKTKHGSEEYVKQVTELQNKYKELEATIPIKVNETAAAYRARLEKLAIQTKMNFNWDDKFSPDVREAVYNAALNSELQKAGAKMIFDEDQNDFKIVQLADESLPLIKDGKQYGFSDFHGLTLQNHKLIKESGQPGGNGNPGSGTPGFQAPNNPGAGTPKEIPSYMANALAESQKTMSEMRKANS